MKRLVLASMICLAFAARSYAQEKFQLIPPEKLLEFPLVHPGSQAQVHVVDLGKPRTVPPGSLGLTLKVNQSAVCSAPLLEAHVNAVDPGIAFKPGNTAVSIPQARLPAPPCETK